MDALLADLCGPHHGECFLLVHALRERIPAKPQSLSRNGADYRRQFSQHLQKRYGFLSVAAGDAGTAARGARLAREESLPVYFTIDAGPNIHLICEAETAPTVEQRLRALPAVRQVLTSAPGPGPQLWDEHLF